ncbi:MAG: hypothetical protein WCS01_12460 [bacterium]
MGLQHSDNFRAWSQLAGAGMLGVGILVSVFTLVMTPDVAKATFIVSFPLTLLGGAILLIGQWITNHTHPGGSPRGKSDK